jgi:hypothetical protein
MNDKIEVVGVAGATFISAYGIIIDRRTLIGDWEGGQWGDGKFPGIAAVSAIATLREGARVTEDESARTALNKAADKLTLDLSDQINSFQRALGSAAKR